MKKIFFGLGFVVLAVGAGMLLSGSQLQASVFANEMEDNSFVPPAGCGCTSKSECMQQGCAALQETSKPKSCGCKK